MNTKSIQDRFAEFKNANYFSRIDNEHLLELFIGLDDQSRKTIELRSSFFPQKIISTSSIEVNQYRKESYNTLRFSLTDNEISGLFYTFCDDLVEQTRDLRNLDEGYKAVVNRFYQWKKLFISSKKHFLTEPEIMGLIGELLFLKGNLASRIGLSNALKSWSGQELTHKDFSFQSSWFEVKTIARSMKTVRISSLEQLDSEFDGELIVFALEKMSAAYNGITLNNVALETAKLFQLNEEKDDFFSKLALQGYEYNNYYDDFVYEKSGFSRYSVNRQFPKIIKGKIPGAIVKVSYDLLLKDISEFELKA